MTASLRLVSGWFPFVLTIAAVGALVGALVRRPDAASGRRLLWAVGAAAVAVGLIAVWWKFAALVGDHIPPSFYLWVGLPILAISGAIVFWRQNALWRRSVSIAAVPLTLLFAANTINSHYGYLPDVDALLGHVHNRLSKATLAAVLGGPQPSPPPPTSLGSRPSSPASPPSSSVPVTVTVPRGGDGAVAFVTIPGAVSGFHAREAAVWLPPAFFSPHRPALPVLVLVAGSPGRPVDWINGVRVDTVANEWAHRRGGVAPVIAMVDQDGSFTADTECVDGPRGRAETYLAVDVPAFLRAEFGVSADHRDWAIEGLSAGGTCALVTGLRHPETYSTFIDLSGELRPQLDGGQRATLEGLYRGDWGAWWAHDPLTLMAHHRFPGLRGLFVVGASDHDTLAANRVLAAAASAAGIDARLIVVKGEHSFPFWASAFAETFPWVMSQIGPAAVSPRIR